MRYIFILYFVFAVFIIGFGSALLIGGTPLSWKIVCILLIVLQWLFPITYTSLGYLSPERVKHTLLLKQLVDVLPIAI